MFSHNFLFCLIFQWKLFSLCNLSFRTHQAEKHVLCVCAKFARLDQWCFVKVITPCRETEEPELFDLVLQGSVFVPIKWCVQTDTLGRNSLTLDKCLHNYKNMVSFPPLFTASYNSVQEVTPTPSSILTSRNTQIPGRNGNVLFRNCRQRALKENV